MMRWIRWWRLRRVERKLFYTRQRILYQDDARLLSESGTKAEERASQRRLWVMRLLFLSLLPVVFLFAKTLFHATVLYAVSLCLVFVMPLFLGAFLAPFLLAAALVETPENRKEMGLGLHLVVCIVTRVLRMILASQKGKIAQEFVWWELPVALLLGSVGLLLTWTSIPMLQNILSISYEVVDVEPWARLTIFFFFQSGFFVLSGFAWFVRTRQEQDIAVTRDEASLVSLTNQRDALREGRARMRKANNGGLTVVRSAEELSGALSTSEERGKISIV